MARPRCRTWCRTELIQIPLLVLLTLVMAGCASGRAKKALNEIKEVLDPLLGKSEAEVVLALGPPQTREVIGGLNVWRYSKSYGVKSKGGAYTNPYYPYYANSVGRSWEVYDQIDLYFENGRLVNWRAQVQR